MFYSPHHGQYFAGGGISRNFVQDCLDLLSLLAIVFSLYRHPTDRGLEVFPRFYDGSTDKPRVFGLCGHCFRDTAPSQKDASVVGVVVATNDVVVVGHDEN